MTRLPIPEDEKDSIIQYCAEIEANQVVADLDKLKAPGLGPLVPWLLPRQLELRLGGIRKPDVDASQHQSSCSHHCRNVEVLGLSF